MKTHVIQQVTSHPLGGFATPFRRGTRISVESGVGDPKQKRLQLILPLCEANGKRSGLYEARMGL
jgi:hypothetical protein